MPSRDSSNLLVEEIIRLSGELAHAQDVDQLLAMTLERAMAVVGAERCHVIVTRPDQPLEFRISTGTTSDGNDQESDISRTILNQVTASGDPLVLTDALSGSEFTSKSVVDLKIRSIMCVPLISRGSVLGALYVENRSISGAFMEEDLRPLTLFANQAAVTIENALTIARLEERVAARTAEVELAWKQAVEANRLRTIFLSSVAHDLRNPAQVVTASLDLLARNHELSGDQRRVAHRASLSMDQMSRLIDDVQQLSISEVGHFSMNPKSVDLRAFMEQMYAIGAGLPRPSEVEFKLELAANPGLGVFDEARIQQVIMNLLANAMNFTKQGEIVLYLLAPSDDSVRIGVADTGVGLSAADAARAFVRFYRGAAEGVEQRSGVGLGLAICRELVAEHGGELWLVDRGGRPGSDFRFSLPMRMDT